MRLGAGIGICAATFVLASAQAQETAPETSPVIPPLLEIAPAQDHHILLRPRESNLDQLHLALSFEQFRSRSKQDGFVAAEEAMQSRLAASTATRAGTSIGAGDRVAAIIDLSMFYMAHGLNEEALSILTGQLARGDDTRLLYLAGIAAFHAGRFDAAIDYLSPEIMRREPAAYSWRGMAHAELGAYGAAARDLFSARAGEAPASVGAATYHLARASTAIALGDDKRAGDALASLRRVALNDHERSERAILEGRWQLMRGRAKAARKILSRLSTFGEQPAASYATTLLLDLDVAEARLSPDVAATRLEALMLQWRGGAFEREALFHLGNFSEAGDNIERAFKMRRRLQNGYPHADAALRAREQMTASLERLAQSADLPPMAAARIFYNNIDLAPPGAMGDQLIKRLARDLVALDLNQQAAELLEHQIFNRLRGAERSIAAAELADIYMKSGRPREALRVLRSTRFARLPEAVVAARRLAEATALWRSDQAAAALALLGDDVSFEAARLRGDIHWRNNDWPEAGSAYAAAVSILTDSGAALEPGHSDLVLRAAAALSMSGDSAGFKAFDDVVRDKIANDKVLVLLGALREGASPASLIQFTESYQAVFSDEKTPS